MSGAQKIIVSRGDRYDVAEWGPGDPSWFGAATEVYRPSNAPFVFAGLAVVVAVLGWVLLMRNQAPALGHPLVATVADLQAVHAGVRLPVRLRRSWVSGGNKDFTPEESRLKS